MDFTSSLAHDEIPLDKNSLDLGTVEYGIDILLKTTNEKYLLCTMLFKNDETSN